MIKQKCIPVGCVPSAAVAISWGGCLPGGVSAPPRNRMTDACENITFVSENHTGRETMPVSIFILVSF